VASAAVKDRAKALLLNTHVCMHTYIHTYIGGKVASAAVKDRAFALHKVLSDAMPKPLTFPGPDDKQQPSDPKAAKASNDKLTKPTVDASDKAAAKAPNDKSKQIEDKARAKPF
jgi:hypothetical protein